MKQGEGKHKLKEMTRQSREEDCLREKGMEMEEEKETRPEGSVREGKGKGGEEEGKEEDTGLIKLELKSRNSHLKLAT